VRSLFLLTSTILLIACSPSDPVTVPGAPARTNESTWELTLSVSGGIAGRVEETVIRSGPPTITITNQRTGSARSAELAPDDLQALQAAIDPARAAPQRSGLESQCADCIQYRLDIRDGQNRYQANYNTATIAGSVDEQLITNILRIGRAVADD